MPKDCQIARETRLTFESGMGCVGTGLGFIRVRDEKGNEMFTLQADTQKLSSVGVLQRKFGPLKYNSLS